MMVNYNKFIFIISGHKRNNLRSYKNKMEYASHSAAKTEIIKKSLFISYLLNLFGKLFSF